MIGKNWFAHVACGYILRRIVVLAQCEETRATASLTEAANRIEDWCKANGLKGGRQNVIRYLWPRYKSVSHLWAAFYVMQNCDLFPPRLSMRDSFAFFCGTAQWILEQATVFVPKHGRNGETIITLDDAWTIPDDFVPRTENGQIRYYAWSNDPDAHDIRKLGRPPSICQV
jgi:hypothetical protein